MNSTQTIRQILEWKKNGLKVVFTNGCFDLLHPGHVYSLKMAKSFGDLLIVGINSDESVKRLKGIHRPLISENDRVKMVEALEMVDAVILFEQDTPEQLITDIQPDVLVKGNDYKIDNIAGAKIVLENGGNVELIPYLEGYSTTELIERIKNLK